MQRYFYRVLDRHGEFRSVSSPQWEEYQNSVKTFDFTLSTSTADRITLFDATRRIFVSLPVAGGQAFFMWEGDPAWRVLFNVDRIERQFTPAQQNTLKQDLQRARDMLDKMLARLTESILHPTSSLQDMRQKVRKVFKINVIDPAPANLLGQTFEFTNLVANFKTLRTVGFDQPFPIVFEPDYVRDLAAWVNGTTDPTMHVAPVYFYLDPGGGAETMIHERAHTVLQLQGHPPNTGLYVGIDPAEGDPGMSAADAIRNPYCYEWLTRALQN